MLSHAEAFHASGVDPHDRSQIEAQTGGIEAGTGSDNPGIRQAGELLYPIGNDIHRICNDDKDAIKARLHDFRNHFLHNFHSASGHVHADHARRIRGGNGKNNQVQVSAVGISPGGHPDIVPGIAHGVLQVQHFGHGLLFIPVNENEVVAEVLRDEIEGQRRADIACSDDAYFLPFDCHIFLLPYFVRRSLPDCL